MTEPTCNAPVIIGDDAIITEVVDNNNQLSIWQYFTTPVYHINKPEYISGVLEIFNEHINQIKQTRNLDPIYPLYQTGNLVDDLRMQPLTDYIGSSAWNILQSMGYNMPLFDVYFSELWGQEHHKHSAHEEHVHGNSSQIVGFFFLETPENSSRIVIHDPRPAKRMINLPELDSSQVTVGSTAINFQPKPGELYFLPSWVPHSFTRHSNDEPLKFLHFTISVRPKVRGLDTPPPAEIV